MSRLRTRTLVAALLPWLALGIAGCRHKVVAPAPQVSTAPPLPPSSMTQAPTVPKLPAPEQPQVGPPGSDQKAEEVKPAPPRHPRRSKKHPATDPSVVASTTTSPQAPGAAAPAQPTTAVAPPAPTLGQLSAGTGANSHERAAMSEQIHAQELRLSKIKQPLNDDDRAITEQVQAFLSKARQAVIENDLDGAQTLTTKAKVLLDELTRS